MLSPVSEFCVSRCNYIVLIAAGLATFPDTLDTVVFDGNRYADRKRRRRKFVLTGFL